MTALLLDTHAWAWSFMGDPRLAPSALATIAQADNVLVSPISFFEIAEKVRLGKWPEMVPFITQLPGILKRQGGNVAQLEPAICIAAGTLAWPHRDPFDRLLAATALHYKLAILSLDTVFDEVITRRW